MNRIPMCSANTPFRGATLSPCGKYRYALWRRWYTELPDAVWVMMNPSTADAMQDDPTIRRVVGFTRQWKSFGGVYVVNLYALRATDPKEVLHGLDDSVGPDNDAHIIEAGAKVKGLGVFGACVAAWGTKGGERADEVMDILRHIPARVYALRVTKDGHPQHPLYVPNGTKPVRYHGRDR